MGNEFKPVFNPQPLISAKDLDINFVSVPSVAQATQFTKALGISQLQGAILKQTIALQNKLLDPNKSNVKKMNFGDVTYAPDDFDRTGMGGMPVFSNLFIKGDKYSVDGRNVSFDDITINLCLISVRSEKEIVKTKVQGRNGTVKQYISDGDDEVTIQGTFVGGGTDQYPRELIANLIKALDCPKPLIITSWYLNMFDISQIVIESRDMGQEEGVGALQRFSFTGLSDAPTILKIAQSQALNENVFPSATNTA